MPKDSKGLHIADLFTSFRNHKLITDHCNYCNVGLYKPKIAPMQVLVNSACLTKSKYGYFTFMLSAIFVQWCDGQ